MSRIIALFILAAAAGLCRAQEAAPAPADPIAAAFGAIRSGQFDAAEMQAASIRNPAAKYFVQAYIEKEKGNPKGALEAVTQGIVLYPNDRDWTAKSELMSTALYIQLGMLDSADVAARQIQMIYEGTDVADKATALRSKIDQLKKEMEEEGTTK